MEDIAEALRQILARPDAAQLLTLLRDALERQPQPDGAVYAGAYYSDGSAVFEGEESRVLAAREFYRR